MARTVQSGDTVAVHYTGRLEDGTVFDRSDDPLEFEAGSDDLIPGFSNGVVGMEVGETKELRLGPDDAYGPIRDELRVWVERDRLPDEPEPEVGHQLQVKTQSGEQLVGRIGELEPERVLLDFNHPLAGKALVFEVEVVRADGS